MSDAVNEFVITESGITITVTVAVSDEGAKPSDRSRCEGYGEEIANKMFIKAAKRFGPKRVKLTKTHNPEPWAFLSKDTKVGTVRVPYTTQTNADKGDSQ